MIKHNSSYKDLAICGGTPAFSEKLHVNKPNLGDSDFFIDQTKTILQSYQFTNNGPFVQQLEEQLASYLNVKQCILTNNGTMGLAILVQALNLKGEVIVPSFNFISTAHTLMMQGIKPVFCDIDQANWNIDPHHCESLINDQTSAIIGTHLWGRSCNIDQLEEIADRHNLKLIFDAAHAFGCSHKGERIGGFGLAEVFSFHATKVFHTFEGGAITTNNSTLAERLRVIQNFGFIDYDEVALIGTNAKMPEISAAMGIANLLSIHTFYERNKNVYKKYQQHLANIAGVSLLSYDDKELNNYHYIVLQVDETVTHLTRDELIDVLHKENILARRYFYPGNHKMEPYRSIPKKVEHKLPITDLIASRVLLLPGGSGVTEAQVTKVCSILELAVKNAVQIAKTMNKAVSLKVD